ncbi:hypothetical protein NS355_03435 [Sphingomonas yabuuchiae]|uniref:Uncharacterized protein n=1 Tax=Sphingomonas yabuuchiae TaxID=172044 RepID=A0A147IXW9_9SPHN|nr:hypothetical protein NS355_03435 [Sphingomonas yabuuchiae]
MLCESLGEQRVLGRHHALLKRFQQSSHALFRFDLLPPDTLEILMSLRIRGIGFFEDGLQQFEEPVALEDTIRQNGEDDAVELVLADRARLTAPGTTCQLRVAGIVDILARLAGADRHASPAAGCVALQDTGQQRRAVGDTRRRHLGGSPRTTCRDLCDDFGRDDFRAWHDDALFDRGLSTFAVGRSIEIMAAVMLAGQDAIDAAVEEFAATHPVSQGVQMLSDRTCAHWRAVEAASRQIVDHSNDGGFFLHDEEFAAFLASFDDHGASLVAERHRPAVEIS